MNPSPRRRRRLDVLIVSVLLLAIALPAGAAVRLLALNARPAGTPALNNAGQVVWASHGLYLWDGAAVRQITADDRSAIAGWQFSDSGQVVWVAGSGGGYAIDLWDGVRVRTLAQYRATVEPPRINATGQAVWVGDDQIYLWDGSQVRQLSAGTAMNSHPRLNDAGQVVWAGAGQIYLWSGGGARQLTRTPAGHSLFNSDPEINAVGQAVWTGILDSHGWNVYFWDGSGVSRLTQPGRSASGPVLNDVGQIAWQDTDPITYWKSLDVWDGTRIQQLTPPGSTITYELNYQINDRGQVVWDGQKPGDGFVRVLLWEGDGVLDLAQHQVYEPHLQLGEGGLVLWTDRIGLIPELFLWDGTVPRQLSNNQAWGDHPSSSLAASTINRAGQVAWSDDSGAVYLYTPAPGSLDVQPDPIVEGRTALGTVTLPRPAPPGGAVVTLSSDNPAVTVPAVVGVPAGSTAKAFPVRTTLLPGSATATLSAAYGGDTWTAKLQVTHVALATMTTDGESVSLALDGPAPPGGAWVTMTTDPPDLIDLTDGDAEGVASSITKTLAAGQRQATVLVFGRHPVSQPTTVTIAAAYGGVTRTATLPLQPAHLNGIGYSQPTISASSGFRGGVRGDSGEISGGVPLDGGVGMDGPAGPAGLVVTLTSDNPAAASVPASVTVPPGANGNGFPIVTHPVPETTVVHLTASAGGVVETVALTVASFRLTALTLDPAAILGGSPERGTVSLSGPAPAGGATVALSTLFFYQPPAVPATVTVPAGATSATFPITTAPVRVPFPITIQACFGGVIQSATLQLLPPALTSFTLSAPVVKGGSTVTGTLTLNGGAPLDTFSPVAGATVRLESDDPAVVSVPQQVVIPEGMTTIAFSVQTQPVTAPITITLTASYLGGMPTAMLKLTP